LVRRLPPPGPARPDRGSSLPAGADLRPRLARVGGPRRGRNAGRSLRAAGALPGFAVAAHLLLVCGRAARRPAPVGDAAPPAGRELRMAARSEPGSRPPAGGAVGDRARPCHLARAVGGGAGKEIRLAPRRKPRAAGLPRADPPHGRPGDGRAPAVRRARRRAPSGLRLRAGPRPAIPSRGAAGRGRPARSGLRRALVRRRDDRPPRARRGPRAARVVPEGRHLRRREPPAHGGQPGRRLRSLGSDRRGRGADPLRHRRPRGGEAPGAAARATCPGRRRAGHARAPGRRGGPARDRAPQPPGRDPRPSHGRRRPRLAGPGHRPHLSRDRPLRDPPRPPRARAVGPRRVGGPGHRSAGHRLRPPGARLSRCLPPLRRAGGGRGPGDAGGGRGAPPAGGRVVSADKEGGERPRRGIGTRAVHGNGGPRQGSLTTPIVQSSTFVFDSAREMRRYLDGDPDLAFEFYTRYGNPTLRALEEALAALEGAEAGVVFASGMSAATTGILSVLEAGDEVLASASLYGGTTKFVRDLLPKWGMSSRILPPADLLK